MGIVIQEGTDDAEFPSSGRVEANLEVRSPRVTRWDCIVVGADDRKLRVSFLEGVVEHLHHVDVREDDPSVTVTVFVGTDAAFSGRAVVALGLPRWTEMMLERPLAGREILDGAVDRGPEVAPDRTA